MTSYPTYETARAMPGSNNMNRETRNAPKSDFPVERISEIVQDFYDIGMVIRTAETFRGITNRGFDIIVEKQGKRKSYFLRKYKHGIKENEIRFEHALSEYAIRNGMNMIPGVVASRTGETFTVSADPADIFAIFEYLPGEDKYTWDYSDLTDPEFVEAGRVLADYHNAVRDFDPGELKRSEPPILELWRMFPDIFKRFGRSRRAGDTFVCFRKNLQGILEVISRNPFDPADAEGMPVIPAHYDYHPGNLKWEGERIVGLFDFDWSKMDLRLFDVCMALVFFAGSREDGRRVRMHSKKLSLFLGGYQRRLEKTGGMPPISRAETGRMPVLLIIGVIYLLHWVVSDYHDKENANDREYLEHLEYCVRLMHWLESRQTDLARTIAETLDVK